MDGSQSKWMKSQSSVVTTKASRSHLAKFNSNSSHPKASVASERYATIQTDGTINNIVEVVPQTKSMFHQAASLAWWMGGLVVSSARFMADVAYDALMTIGSATIAVTAVSTAVVKPVLAQSLPVASVALCRLCWPRYCGSRLLVILLKWPLVWFMLTGPKFMLLLSLCP